MFIYFIPTVQRTIVPLNGSIKNSPASMAPKRAQSVEYTFFNDSGDIDEIQFYTDDHNVNLDSDDDELDRESIDRYEVPISNTRGGGYTNEAFTTENEADGVQSQESESGEEADVESSPSTSIEHTYLRPPAVTDSLQQDDKPSYVNLQTSSSPRSDNEEDVYVLHDPPQNNKTTDTNSESEEEPEYAEPVAPRGIAGRINHAKGGNGDEEEDYVQPDPPPSAPHHTPSSPSTYLVNGDDDYVQPDPPRPDGYTTSGGSVGAMVSAPGEQPNYVNLKTRKL